MPVCLKCGSEIKPGNNYCDDCGALGEQEVKNLSKLDSASRYKPRGRRDRVWLVVILVSLFVAIGLIAFALLRIAPTNSKFAANADASLCQKNLEQIQSALDQYYTNSKQFPPAGRLTARSPLVTDGYLEGVPHCPSTGHEYVLVRQGDSMTVVCDSGLPGHSIGATSSSASSATTPAGTAPETLPGTETSPSVPYSPNSSASGTVPTTPSRAPSLPRPGQ